jgi:hypothetical protein
MRRRFNHLPDRDLSHGKFDSEWKPVVIFALLCLTATHFAKRAAPLPIPESPSPRTCIDDAQDESGDVLF